MKPFALIKLTYSSDSEDAVVMEKEIIETFEREDMAYRSMRKWMTSFHLAEEKYCVMKLHYLESNNRIVKAEGVY
ncbi:hypothetical protein Pan241w_10920 [Gimesia alba]|uniref:Uncharacterized protein n=1 Tax=Gimesia alba TaxID=2527973 RepID=A0A517RB61_9PLAN|nr:hypothetical protein [Gimesia alba]QDT41033.1 hypothetical protein Pan241w_10920 [Gimesia alba]